MGPVDLTFTSDGSRRPSGSTGRRVPQETPAEVSGSWGTSSIRRLCHNKSSTVADGTFNLFRLSSSIPLKSEDKICHKIELSSFANCTRGWGSFCSLNRSPSPSFSWKVVRLPSSSNFRENRDLEISLIVFHTKGKGRRINGTFNKQTGLHDVITDVYIKTKV